MGYAVDPLTVTRDGDRIHVVMRAVRPGELLTLAVRGPGSDEPMAIVADANGEAEFDVPFHGSGEYVFDVYQGDDLEHDVAESTVTL